MEHEGTDAVGFTVSPFILACNYLSDILFREGTWKLEKKKKKKENYKSSRDRSMVVLYFGRSRNQTDAIIAQGEPRNLPTGRQWH
jgi:hypothetical protein